MKLIETTEMMNSADYKERFKAEYIQLKIRMIGLDAMLKKYKAETLTFTPTCSYDLLNKQYKAMSMYASYLEDRAAIEDINLGTSLQMYKAKLQRLKNLKKKEPNNTYHDWDKEIAQCEHNIVEHIEHNIVEYINQIDI